MYCLERSVKNLSEITTEIWKPIKGYEGLYEVSNLGRVKSVARNMIRKTYIKKDKGYEIIMLCKNGRGKNHSVHRLVAEAFIPNPYGKREINHKDYNRANNNVANLEWVTRVENIVYSLPNRPKEKNIGENEKHIKNTLFKMLYGNEYQFPHNGNAHSE